MATTQFWGEKAMKQLVQNYKAGELRIARVSPPALKPGGVLMRNTYSLISAGTERITEDVNLI